MPKRRKGFAAPSDPILKSRADIVRSTEFGTEKFEELIERMMQAAYGEQSDRSKPLMVGLAAPQIGINARIILVDTKADGRGNVSTSRVYVNPEIIFSSGEFGEWYEACYSADRVAGIVKRPNKITVRYTDKAGQTKEESFQGYVARIFQHEIDHLNGKMFVDHIADDANLHWVEDEEFPEYRDQGAWRIWPKKCSREKWLSIRGGERQVE